METIGFKVDKSFIIKFLKKYLVVPLKMEEDLSDFLQSYKGYLQKQALKSYKNSCNAVENFEYELNASIG